MSNPNVENEPSDLSVEDYNEPSIKEFNEDKDVIGKLEKSTPEKSTAEKISLLKSSSELQSTEGIESQDIRVTESTGLVTLAPDSKLIIKNWSLKKKLWHTIAYGLTTCSAQLCASIISPDVEQISSELHVGTEVATLSFSVFVLGNMVGPVLFAPLSELYGRKIGILIPTFLAGGAMCICANVTSIAALTVFRFLSGVLAAAPIVNSVGALGDMWAPHVLVRAIVLYALNLVLGAVSAPVFGSLLVTTGNYGWRWACWLGGLTAMSIALLNIITLSETFQPVVEQKVVRKIRLRTGIWALHANHDKWEVSGKELISVHLARPFIMFITPIVLLMNVFSAFVYGLFFLIITSVGFEFQTVHHFGIVSSYLPLFGFLIGIIFGGLFNIVCGNRYSKIASQIHARPPPEERLLATVLAGWIMPCGMFIYGWTMKPWIHWIVPIVGLGLVGTGFMVIFQGCLMYLIDIYIQYIASVIGSNTILRSVFGGVFPLFAIQMYKGLGVHWASSLLGFVGIALTAASYLFWFFGPLVRRQDPFKKMEEKKDLKQ